jgi:hypothetical protein
MVFKLADGFYGLDFPFQQALFGVAGSESVRKKYRIPNILYYIDLIRVGVYMEYKIWRARRL